MAKIQLGGDLSAYKMVGSDKIILRRKGGASKEKIKQSAAFVNTRRINAEFGGRSTTTKWMLPVFRPLKHIANRSLTGRLNKLLKPIQELDSINEWGKRNVSLSLKPQLLEGFNLNHTWVLESIIRP